MCCRIRNYCSATFDAQKPKIYLENYWKRVIIKKNESQISSASFISNIKWFLIIIEYLKHPVVGDWFFAMQNDKIFASLCYLCKIMF